MLYLMRHGEASAGYPDAGRILTKRGEDQVAQVARFLKNSNPQLCAIWHSPLKRATQTAHIISEILDHKHSCQMKQGFSPNDSASIACDFIGEFFTKVSHQNLFIVSHLPLLPQIAGELLGHKEIQFVTASCLCLLQDENQKWQVHDFISPTL